MGKKKTKWRKGLALLLSVMLLAGQFPFPVHAAATGWSGSVYTIVGQEGYPSSSIRLESDTTLDMSGADATCNAWNEKRQIFSLGGDNITIQGAGAHDKVFSNTYFVAESNAVCTDGTLTLNLIDYQCSFLENQDEADPDAAGMFYGTAKEEKNMEIFYEGNCHLPNMSSRAETTYTFKPKDSNSKLVIDRLDGNNATNLVFDGGQVSVLRGMSGKSITIKNNCDMDVTLQSFGAGDNHTGAISSNQVTIENSTVDVSLNEDSYEWHSIIGGEACKNEKLVEGSFINIIDSAVTVKNQFIDSTVTVKNQFGKRSTGIGRVEDILIQNSDVDVRCGNVPQGSDSDRFTAGIGGKFKNITIEKSTVNAEGYSGAGIGLGNRFMNEQHAGEKSFITITGSAVTASSVEAAGIGACPEDANTPAGYTVIIPPVDIRIAGNSTVTSRSINGAGIGGGQDKPNYSDQSGLPIILTPETGGGWKNKSNEGDAETAGYHRSGKDARILSAASVLGGEAAPVLEGETPVTDRDIPAKIKEYVLTNAGTLTVETGAAVLAESGVCAISCSMVNTVTAIVQNTVDTVDTAPLQTMPIRLDTDADLTDAVSLGNLRPGFQSIAATVPDVKEADYYLYYGSGSAPAKLMDCPEQPNAGDSANGQTFHVQAPGFSRFWTKPGEVSSTGAKPDEDAILAAIDYENEKLIPEKLPSNTELYTNEACTERFDAGNNVLTPYIAGCLYARYAGETKIGDNVVTAVEIPGRPDMPDMNSYNITTTVNSITINNGTGGVVYNYAKKDETPKTEHAVTCQADNEPVIFSNLLANEKYTLYARYPASNDNKNFHSAQNTKSEYTRKAETLSATILIEEGKTGQTLNYDLSSVLEDTAWQQFSWPSSLESSNSNIITSQTGTNKEISMTLAQTEAPSVCNISGINVSICVRIVDPVDADDTDKTFWLWEKVSDLVYMEYYGKHQDAMNALQQDGENISYPAVAAGFRLSALNEFGGKSSTDVSETKVTVPYLKGYNDTYGNDMPYVLIRLDDAGTPTRITDITLGDTGISFDGEAGARYFLVCLHTTYIQKVNLTWDNNTETNLILEPNEECTLKAKITPVSAPVTSVTWSSNQPNIVTVDENGKVTAVNAGEAEITATATGAHKLNIETCTVTVTVSHIQLSAPGSLAWSAQTPGKISWDSVENAASYTVRLYRDGIAQGDAVTVNGTEYTFPITEAGSYTVKVKAVGAGNYADSAETTSKALQFYQVQFDTNGGNAIAPQITAHGAKVQKPQNPVREGYAFKGWYSDSSFAESSSWDFDSSLVTKTTTLYAKWELIRIPLSAPGSLTWSAQTPGKISWNSVENAASYTVQLYRDGNAQGDAVTVNGTEYTFPITEAGSYNVKVKAVGAGNYADSAETTSKALQFYQVQFDTNGGNAIAPQIAAHGAKVKAPSNPVREGYVFKGWYSDSSWDFDSSSVAGTTTLYAKWEKKKPSGSYNPPSAPVENAPYIAGQTEKMGWITIIGKITEVIKKQSQKPGSSGTVTVDMNGTTKVPQKVIETIAGKDITVVLDMGNGITWAVNGTSVTDSSMGEIDFAVWTGTHTIPVDVINKVTGEKYSMNLSLAHNGAFGFTAVLTLNMGPENAGLYANLFYYNPKAAGADAPAQGALEFLCADRIDEKGSASLKFTHASDYTIVIDNISYEKEDTSGEENGRRKVVAQRLKAVAGKNAVRLTWSRVKGADGYLIYGAPCGSSMKLVKTVKDGTANNFTRTGLKSAKSYKFAVRAYKLVDGKKVTVTKSWTVHAVTKGGRYGNPAKVTCRAAVTLEKGKNTVLRPKQTSGRPVKLHTAEFCYLSSDKTIAAVDKNGRVRGLKAGTCNIYVYAQNGQYARVRVTVI